MNIGKFGEVKIYMDGKEIGDAENTITAPPLEVNKPFGTYSLTLKMSEEDSLKLQWELDRPKRIRKYIKQIFRLKRYRFYSDAPTAMFPTMEIAKKLLKNVYKDVDPEGAVYISFCDDPKEIKALLRDLKSFCITLIKAIK